MHERRLNMDFSYLKICYVEGILPILDYFFPIGLNIITGKWSLLYSVLQIACGKGAGAFTCLLDESGRYGADDFSVTGLHPDFKVDSLSKIHNILETNFDLSP